MVLSFALFLSVGGCLSSKEEYLALRWALLDQDGDGYVWDHFPDEGGTDCDDFNASVNPGVDEIPYNHRDDDCDAATVDDDLDDDGYPVEVDCDDQNAMINPGAVDERGDGIDQDCTGSDMATAGMDSDLDVIRIEDIKSIGENLSNEQSEIENGEDIPTEATTVSGRVFDESYSLKSGELVDLGIWASDDIQGVPPFDTPPMAEIEKPWDEINTNNFTIEFDLPAGESITAEIYALSGDPRYAASGEFELEAGEWVTNIELSLGSNLDWCTEDHQSGYSMVCGEIYDSTGYLDKGQPFKIVVIATSEYSGEDWNDAFRAGTIGITDSAWEGAYTGFTIQALIEDSEEVRLFIWSEEKDGDVQPDIWGKTEPFIWKEGEHIVDLSISFEEVIL